MSNDDEHAEEGCLATTGRCLVRLAIGGLLLLCVAIGGYGHYRTTMSQPVLDADERTSFRIERGASWTEIVDRLERAGLVANRTYFQIWARTRGLPRAVKAGAYQFEGPLDTRALASRLREGTEGRDVEVTIPEGWTIFDIADHLSEEGLVDRSTFLETARAPELLASFDLQFHDSFEGYLFPDTYRFHPDATAEDVVRRMHRRWRRIWTELRNEHEASWTSLKQSYEFERHDVVTIASIVQAETRVDRERRLVARVVLNRLDADMRLQMDPTCVYGPDHYDDVPTPEICDDASNAYSTYAHDGLPPGPIGNPGRASLEGALDPADGAEAKSYLYYVARQDGTGRHVFSKTYREHRRAIDAYLK
jgi:UPF0755 protein